MDAYRDPLAALRSQIVTKRVIVADLERTIPAIALDVLSDSDSIELAARRAAASDDAVATPTVESLCAMEGHVDALHAILVGVAEHWTLPKEPPIEPLPPRPWEEGPVGMADLRALLESTFGEGTVERFGGDAMRVRFLDEGAVFLLVAEAFPTTRRVLVEVGHLAVTLRASMPHALPAFELGPELDVGAYQNRIRSPHWLHGDLPKRKKRELRPERAFWTSGHEGAAAALVDDEVHDDLHELLSTCVLEAPRTRAFPSMRGGPGFIEIAYTCEWEGESTELIADAGLRVAHRIRACVKGARRST